MTISKLNIARDCWWAIPSGDNFVTDENLQLSSYGHGLYKSINTNDSQYIQFHGSGVSSPYVGRLENTNIVPERIVVDIRAAGTNTTWSSLYVNNELIGDLGYFGSIATSTYNFDLSSDDQLRILQGRVGNNYDYFHVVFADSGVLTNVKLHNIDVYYSGSRTWDTYTSGLPNVKTAYAYPNELKFSSNSTWANQNDSVVSASGYYHINMSPSGAGTDNSFIYHKNTPTLNLTPFYVERPVEPDVKSMPNGGLSLVFDASSVPSLSPVTRARMTLRMSLPPSGLYQNARDVFEINGYNPKYKEQDNKHEMSAAVGSISPLNPRYGYYVYGAGPIVEQSGFKNYTVELDFLDPYTIGDIASTKHRNIDIFKNMEFRLVGLPSGVQLSAAQLYLEYLTNNMVGLYTVGGPATIRHTVSSYVDAGNNRSWFFGDGAWQHRGNLNEAEIFDAFYDFSEVSGQYIYPTSLNDASGAYGQYVNAIYEDGVYDGEVLVDLVHTVVPVEPVRKNVYRNPVRTEFGTTYDPTHYRNMIYNASPFKTWDIHDPNATAYASGVAQVYFDDRMVLGSDFTLYFSLYREPTNQGQNFAQFFHRGHLGSVGSVEYEIQGFLEPEKITVVVKDTNDTTHSVSLALPEYSLEPILVWITCEYVDNNTTLTLYVHKNTKNYFYEDWLSNSVSFAFPRKQYVDSKTMLGPLYTPSDLDQQLAFSSFFSWVSLVEFGWADSAIALDYNTTSSTIQTNYDVSDDVDKKFISSRLATSKYLLGGGYISSTLASEPILQSTAWIYPSMVYQSNYGSTWQSPAYVQAWDNYYGWAYLPPVTLPGTGQSRWLMCKFDVTTSERVELGDVNSGIAVDDAATGTGYIMHSRENLFDRFVDDPPYAGNSNNLLAVRWNGTSWQYNDNSSSWYDFIPASGDRLLASIDMSADTITSLEGYTGLINGIPQGFTSGDLTFLAEWYSGGSNPGEFTVNGTEFFLNYQPIGIEVNVAGKTGGYTANTYKVQLGYYQPTSSVDIFSPIGTSQADTGATVWDSVYRSNTYGGPNNTFGLGSSLTKELLDDDNLLLGVQFTGNAANAAYLYVDYVRAKVYMSGDNGLSVNEFKALNWDVVSGSGEAKTNTRYLIDYWKNNEHSIFNPINTAGTNHIVHPSAIYVEITTEHNTNHPSGVSVFCDIEFDTGTTDNWKVARSEFVIPSSTLTTRMNGISKHINMSSGPINCSDVSQINLNLTTQYPDLGSESYYGDLKVTAVKVYFDAFSVSVTGGTSLDLYTVGTFSSQNQQTDLFVEGMVQKNSNFDLFVEGSAYSINDNVTLYMGTGEDNISNIATLFIEGLTPGSGNNNMTLYTWGTPAGVYGLYKGAPLFTRGLSPDQILPLYLHNVPPVGIMSSGSATLYTVSASSVFDAGTELFIHGISDNTNTVPLFIKSFETQASSVPLYIFGSGLPTTKTMKLYTHGY